MNAGHAPARPSWDCADCGRQWPCAIAKRRLLTDTPPASLGLYLGMQLEAAVRDLPDVGPVDLHRRFLGWIRSNPNRTGRLALPVQAARDHIHLGAMGQIRDLLADALACDPELRCAGTSARVDDIHDPAERLADVHARHLLHTHDVRVALDGAAVVGFSAGRCPLDPPAPGLLADYERELTTAAGPYASRWAELARRRDARAPRGAHYHLEHLVVHPHHRRRGVATTLLHDLHRRLDPLGVPVHVQVPEVLMRTLRAHGYDLAGSAVAAGGAAPTHLVAMLRWARDSQRCAAV